MSLTFINDSQRALQCFLLDYMPMVHLKWLAVMSIALINLQNEIKQSMAGLAVIN